MSKLLKRFILMLLLIVAVSSLLAYGIVVVLKLVVYPTLATNYSMILEAVKDFVFPVLTIGFALLMTIYISPKVIDPFVKLTEATKRIAAGDFDVRVDELGKDDELSNLQRNFNRMAKDLQGNEYLKKDFIANLSHEVKTPLAVMKGYATLLGEDRISDAERKEYAQLIAQESERLSKLSANMLRMSKLENEEIIAAPARFQLDEQIRQMVLMLEPQWSEKNIALNIDLPTVYYTGDEELLADVWMNIMENAVKFSDVGGEIAIELVWQREQIAISFRDYGTGMDPQTAQHAFEQFYQGGAVRAKAGSGLGLSIVKRIVELHGGQVKLDSELGRGTAVEIILPVPH